MVTKGNDSTYRGCDTNAESQQNDKMSDTGSTRVAMRRREETVIVDASCLCLSL